MFRWVQFLFLFQRFSSNRCFMLGSTQCERTFMMEFTLETLKTCIVQSAILLFTDFTTENFWSRFQKFAVLTRISSQKSLWCIKVLIIKLQFYQKGSSRQTSLKNLLGGSFFSVKSRVYPCNFIKNGLHSEVFFHWFYKIAPSKISESFIWDFFAIPLLTKLQALNLQTGLLKI